MWELGTLVRRGRISLDRDTAQGVRSALAVPRVTVLALEAEVALAAALLDDSFRGDPADRLIYATAQRAGARLMSRDQRIAQFDPTRVFW